MTTRPAVLTLALVLAGTLPAQVAWRKVAFDAPTPVCLAHDAARAQTLLFCGNDGQRNDTWSWTGSGWSQLLPSTRPPTVTATNSQVMVYDEARRRVLMLLCPFNAGTMWEWDGGTWLARPGLPPTVFFAGNRGIVSDTARGRVLLFGGDGFGAGGTTDEMFSWDGVAWSALAPPAKPSPRGGPLMAYDALRARVVLFGGRTLLTPGSDTWEWDGATWQQLASNETPPWASADSLAWDPTRGRVVRCAPGSGTALYEWTGTQWLAAGTGAAPALVSSAMTFDAARRLLLLYGTRATPGYGTETWANLGGAWVQLHSSFPLANGSKLVYDATMQEVLLLGDETQVTSDPWSWNGRRWLRHPSSGPTPPPRSEPGVAHDGRTLLFGGWRSGSSLFGDTWAWNGSAWTQLVPPQAPSPRARTAMAFDSVRGTTLLFGGNAGSPAGLTNDTWEWNGTTWSQRAPATSPPALLPAGLAYDVARARTVLVGTQRTCQLWEWDGATWSQPSAQPPFWGPVSLCYDAARQSVVVTATPTPSSNTYGTWEWNGVAWSQRVPVGPSVPYGVLTHDAKRSRTMCWSISTWELGGDPLPSAVPFGTACAGSAGTPLLSAATLPWLGEQLVLGLPYSGSGALVLGASRTSWGPTPLPLALAAFGMPGCALHASIDLLVPFSGSLLALQVPNAPPLVGQPFYLQGICVDATANAAGAVLSNALEARVGGW